MIEVSPQILLKPLAMEHSSVIFQMFDSNRGYFRKWLPFIDSRKHEDDIKQYIEWVLVNGDQQFAIYFNSVFTGLIGFKDTDWTNKKTEIGYWLSECDQGKGIVTKSLMTLLDYAFGKLKLNRIQIKAAVDNIKSRNIPERLNFKLEGIERDGEILLDTGYTDLAVYSLLKKDFVDINIICKL